MNISPVYSQFSDGVGHTPLNIPSPGVLTKSIGTQFFYDHMSFLALTTCMEYINGNSYNRYALVYLIYLVIDLQTQFCEYLMLTYLCMFY